MRRWPGCWNRGHRGRIYGCAPWDGFAKPVSEDEALEVAANFLS